MRLPGLCCMRHKDAEQGMGLSLAGRADADLRLAASVFANSYEGIVIADTNDIIVNVNSAFTRITGHTREDAIGKRVRPFAFYPQETELHAKMRESLQECDFWRGEVTNRRKNGEAYTQLLTISSVRDNAGNLQHYIGIFSDISQMKAHEAELDRIAHYDILTGVPNRRLLGDRLGQAIVHARRSGKFLAVCYLDLDGFKPINDRYGHAIGDCLLIEITKRLKVVLRAEDTLARLGGDEFILLFTDLAHLEEIHLVLARVLAAVHAPVLIEELSVNVSASIGVTVYPADDEDADAGTLLHHADQAMYRAKDAGKNCYRFFNPDHNR
jgi:diguanylate cyclase (GGDEF)-like protein/PAS domain S-box-containing protein